MPATVSMNKCKKMIMELTCRVCLQLEELMVHIYDEVEDLQSDLSTLLEQCGGIRLDKNDCFPKYLCKECTSELLIAAKFREKCARTQQALEQYQAEAGLQFATLEENAPNLKEEGEEEMTKIKNAGCIENSEDIIVCIPMPATSGLPTLEENNIKLEENKETLEQNNMTLEEIKATLNENNTAISGLDYEEQYEAIISMEDDQQQHILEEDTAPNELVEEIYLNDVESEGNDLIVVGYEDAEDTEDILFDDIKKVEEQEQVLPSNLVAEKVDIYFECDTCGASFMQAVNLRRHIAKEHLLLQLYVCDKCDHCFSSETQSLTHYQSCKYEKKTGHKINSNASKTKATNSGKRHEQIEKKIKSTNVCSYCDKKLQSSFALNMHLRTHTGERPFKCVHCTKAFKCQSALTLHLKRHSGIPDYVCTICSKTFYESSNLTVHMRTHTGEKPHACKICSKRFSRVFLLQLHMRTHTGEKPFQCAHCERAFAQLCDLKNHTRLHTGLRTYQCPACPKAFIKRYPLLAHIEKQHSSLSSSNGDYEIHAIQDVESNRGLENVAHNITEAYDEYSDAEYCGAAANTEITVENNFKFNDLIVEEILDA